MKRRLIALMLGATIISSSMVACSNYRTNDESKYENEIRDLLESDAKVSIDAEDLERFGFRLYFDVEEDGYRISFVTRTYPVMSTSAVDDTVITYLVDKETYFNFRKNYSLKEAEKEVEMVKELTEKFTPIEVCGASLNSVENNQ